MTSTRRATLAWLGTFLYTPLMAQVPLAGAPTGPLILTVTGDISGHPSGGVGFDAAMVDALPEHSVKATTPWYKESQTFSGPLLKDVLDAVGATGKKLKMVALNDYAVEVPVSDVAKYRPVLARKINGKVLGIRDKGPLFLMYPFDDFPEIRNDVYYARCIWQLNRINVM